LRVRMFGVSGHLEVFPFLSSERIRTDTVE
jgi:hypothetical protein